MRAALPGRDYGIAGDQDQAPLGRRRGAEISGSRSTFPIPIIQDLADRLQ